MTDTLRSRDQAIQELARHGIEGADIYLIDLIPLVEMIWADGHQQDAEMALFNEFIARHVDRINHQAEFEVLTQEAAQRFIRRFLDTRPPAELLATLRSFVAPVRMSSGLEEENQALRASLLAACMDIASASGIDHPYDMRGRFSVEEKRCFFEILESL